MTTFQQLCQTVASKETDELISPLKYKTAKQMTETQTKDTETFTVYISFAMWGPKNQRPKQVKIETSFNKRLVDKKIS